MSNYLIVLNDLEHKNKNKNNLVKEINLNYLIYYKRKHIIDKKEYIKNNTQVYLENESYTFLGYSCSDNETILQKLPLRFLKQTRSRSVKRREQQLSSNLVITCYIVLESVNKQLKYVDILGEDVIFNFEDIDETKIKTIKKGDLIIKNTEEYSVKGFKEIGSTTILNAFPTDYTYTRERSARRNRFSRNNNSFKARFQPINSFTRSNRSPAMNRPLNISTNKFLGSLKSAPAEGSKRSYKRKGSPPKIKHTQMGTTI